MKRKNCSEPITFLTGGRGIGKSSICRQLVSLPGVAGMVSVACETGNAARYGIDAVLADRSRPAGEVADQPLERRVALARVVDTTSETLRRPSDRRSVPYRYVEPPAHDGFPDTSSHEGAAPTLAGSAGDTRIGPYLFSGAALRECDQFLRSLPRRPHVRLIVVDEVGPLELERGEGLIGGLRDLFSSCLPLLVVVRPALVVAACRLAENLRTGCVPETVGIAELENPGDARVLKTLL